MKKVKMSLLVETLLNLVVYVRNVYSKTQRHRLPLIIIISITCIVPNDKRGQ